MTPEEFLKNIDLATIVRKSTKKEKPVSLDKDDATNLALAFQEDIEKACDILRSLFNKYKKAGRFPKEFLQTVYAVIFKECFKLYTEEKEKYKIAPNDKYKLLDEGGMILQKKRPFITERVFKGITGVHSIYQEKWGMTPFNDAMMLLYEPIGLFSLNQRGDLFRRIIIKVLQNTSYSTFIDLSGDITIYEDIFPCGKEILLASDSNVGDFYYSIIHDCDKFKSEFKGILKKISGKKVKFKEIEEKVEKSRCSTTKDLRAKLSKEIKFHVNKGEKYIITYPYQEDSLRVRKAVYYFLSVLGEDFIKKLKNNNMLQSVEERITYLSKRLQNTKIVCGDVESVVCNIQGKVIDLTKDFNKKWNEIKPKPISSKIYNVDYRKTLSTRDKPIMLFYDYTIRQNLKDLISFAYCVNQYTVAWMVVCNKDDIIVREIFKGADIYSYELDTHRYFKNFFMMTKDISMEKVLLTNIKLNGDIYIKEIEESPIFTMLNLALIGNNIPTSAFAKILVRETNIEKTEKDYEYEEIIERLKEEEE